MSVIHQEFVSRAAGCCMNLTCVTSCLGDRDVTALTGRVSHVALRHSASASWRPARKRSCQGASVRQADSPRPAGLSALL
ncbi:hypothetical protein CgunFtcFv8_011127 [Champsocephalus gunnari]|uniref:Uncharacterized protein n=1 Tax=Champsocephalus gunnari TaxID=52237 RepID=A0AAN8DX31_CHAGU|nr:hypothetical protein CgunFtcFv8_011127 [Champsocephalus gunnari]